MSIEFAVGKRVVCIDAFGPIGPQRDAALPQKGDVYTIRDIQSDSQGVGLFLEEIHNAPGYFANGTIEACFDAHCFRPVRETSIDCFTALLAKPPVRLREDA